MKLRVEVGVPHEMINAPGNAEFDPLGESETSESRSTNRLVEMVFLSKIDQCLLKITYS